MPMKVPNRRCISPVLTCRTLHPPTHRDNSIGRTAFALVSSLPASASRIRPSVTAYTSRPMRSMDSVSDTRRLRMISARSIIRCSVPQMTYTPLRLARLSMAGSDSMSGNTSTGMTYGL